MHSLRRLTRFPGDTAASDVDLDVVGNLAMDDGTALFLLDRKNGRSGGASREECFPT